MVISTKGISITSIKETDGVLTYVQIRRNNQDTSFLAIGKVIFERAKMVNVFTITRNFTSVIGCTINDMGKENIFTIIKSSGILEIGAMICDMERVC
jgi:hypothetical protein